MGSALPPLDKIAKLWQGMVNFFMRLKPTDDPECLHYFCSMFSIVTASHEYTQKIIKNNALVERLTQIYLSKDLARATRACLIEFFYTLMQEYKLTNVLDRHKIDPVTMVLMPQLEQLNKPLQCKRVLGIFCEGCLDKAYARKLCTPKFIQILKRLWIHHGSTVLSALIRTLYCHFINIQTRTTFWPFLQANPFILQHLCEQFTVHGDATMHIYTLDSFQVMIELDKPHARVVKLLEELGVRDRVNILVNKQHKENQETSSIYDQVQARLVWLDETFDAADDRMDISDEEDDLDELSIVDFFKQRKSIIE